MSFRARSSFLALALAIPGSASASEAPIIIPAGGGLLAAPYIPGGTVVSAAYKAVGQPWLPVDIEADHDIIGLAPLPFAEDRTWDYEVWDKPVVGFTTHEACVFGLGEGDADDGGACQIGDSEVVIYTGHARYYGLDEDESVMAAAAFELPESLGVLGLALVVETEKGRELRVQQYQESDWDFIQRAVVDLPEGLGSDLVVKAWCHDGVPRVGIMDDSSWWIHTDPMGFVITGDDGGTWTLDLVAKNGFELDTLRVSQLEGDTAGTQRVTVQDGDQLRWLEFVEPDDAVEGAIDIPGPSGVIATELDADLGLYTLSWLLDMGEWGAGLVGNGQIYGYARFGDVDLDLGAGEVPSDLKGLDPSVIPDTWYAIGGNAFLDGDPDRPVIIGSGGLTVAASKTASMPLKAGISGTTARVMAGETAAMRIQVEAGELDFALDSVGGQALTVLSGTAARVGVEKLATGYWDGVDKVQGLADFRDQAESLLGAALGDASDATAVLEGVSLGDGVTIRALARDGYDWGVGEAFTDDEELIDFLIDYPSGVISSLSFSDYGGQGDQVDVVAKAFSGGVLGHLDRRETDSSSAYSSTSATVALGPTDEKGNPSDEYGWAIVSTDPDTPLYVSTGGCLSPLCGGYCYLAGVESTSLATRGEITASYTVHDVIAAGSSGTTAPPHAIRGFISWVSEKGGLSLTGEGELELTVYVIDPDGDRVLETHTVHRFIPEVDDEVIVAVLDTGADTTHEDESWTISTAAIEDEDFGLELVYTLRSSDGGLVTLDNAVAFGFVPDSDGDGLFDDEEFSVYGTDPLLADTDGDGVDDGDDPEPAEPGVGADWLAAEALALATSIECLDLSLVDAANDNAASGRLGSLATRARSAAERFEDGKVSSATALLDGLLDRIDGVDSPEDWLVESDARATLAEATLTLLELAAYE
jgi:hypothetical protein